MPDLFGNPDPPPNPYGRGASGYAAQPGFGPLGETCRTCAHAYVKEHNGKRYWKCGLVRATFGPGSDIRLKSPACRRWEAKK